MEIEIKYKDYKGNIKSFKHKVDCLIDPLGCPKCSQGIVFQSEIDYNRGLLSCLRCNYSEWIELPRKKRKCKCCESIDTFKYRVIRVSDGAYAKCNPYYCNNCINVVKLKHIEYKFEKI